MGDDRESHFAAVWHAAGLEPEDVAMGGVPWDVNDLWWDWLETGAPSPHQIVGAALRRREEPPGADDVRADQAYDEWRALGLTGDDLTAACEMPEVAKAYRYLVLYAMGTIEEIAAEYIRRRDNTQK